MAPTLMRRAVATFAAAALLLANSGAASAGETAPCGWFMASKSASGAASRPIDHYPALDGIVSGNGRFVLFSTDARNLVRGDDDRYSDVFLRDLDTGRVTIAGRGVRGRDPKGDALALAISPDARYIVFSTGAKNVHPSANGIEQVYVRDRSTGAVRMVSRSVTGAPANISTSAASGLTPDGRFVVFTTNATNMLGGSGGLNDSNFKVYVRDVHRKRTLLVSKLPDGRTVGGIGGSISRDGRLVAFVGGTMTSSSEVYVRNIETTRTVRISRNYDGSSSPQLWSAYNAFVTPNGRYVMFTHRSPKIVRNDTNDARDVFVFDRRDRRVERVSVGGGGKQANGNSIGMSISNDGSVVTFTSTARNIDRRVTVSNNGFAHDRISKRTRLFTICDDGTTSTAINQNPDRIMVSGNKRTIVMAAQGRNWSPENHEGRYQVYYRPFDIRRPTVLTSDGPYEGSAGIPVALTGVVKKPSGAARRDVAVRFSVADATGAVLWQASTTTGSDGSATVGYAHIGEPGRYVVTMIVPATASFARATMADPLEISA